MAFKLFLSLEKSIGLDGQVDLTLSANLDSPPVWLSDFVGGHGELYNGYATQRREFTIQTSRDERRIELAFDNDVSAALSPDFVRVFDSRDPLNQLQETPLKEGQILRLTYNGASWPEQYKITGSSWWGLRGLRSFT